MNKSENNKANFGVWKSKKSWIYGASVLTILTGTASPVISSLAESQADKTVATSSTQENVEATSPISIAPITTSTEPSNGEETTQDETGTELRTTSEENKVIIQTNTSEDISTSEEAPKTNEIKAPTENEANLDNNKTTTETLPNGREITRRADGSISSITYWDDMKDQIINYILIKSDGSQELLKSETRKNIWIWFENYADDGQTIIQQGWAGGWGGRPNIEDEFGVKYLKVESSRDYNNPQKSDTFITNFFFTKENDVLPTTTSTTVESSNTSNSQDISSSSSSQTNTSTSTSNKPNPSTSTSDKSTSTSSSQNTSNSSSSQTNSSTSTSNKPSTGTSINTTTNLTSKSTDKNGIYNSPSSNDKNRKKHDISSNKAELPKTGENSFISNLLIALGLSGLVGASILNKKKS